jgi:transposase-like protein
MTEVRSKRSIEIMKAYASGAQVSLIAERFGCTAANVIQLSKYHGVNRGSVVDEKPRREPPAKPEPEIRAPVAEVKRLAAKGLKITQIGALLRCPYRDIAAALSR